MSRRYISTGHAFISYVRENASEVDYLQEILESAGVRVWRDTADLWPGEDWRAKIRHAITGDALVFIACFSQKSVARKVGYQNEELALAIDQLRLRRPDELWFVPVRFDNCEIPDLDIGGGRSLASIQRADLFGDRSVEGFERLVETVLRILKQQGGNPANDEAGTSGRLGAGKGSRMRDSDRKARRKHASSKKSDPIRAARMALWMAVVAALIGLTGVVGLILKPGNGASGNHLHSGDSLSGSRHPSAANASAGASPSPSASGSAKTGNVFTGTTAHKWMYQSNQLVLDNHGCNDHYNYPNATFGPHGLILVPYTSSPPSGTFAVTLYCSRTSSGAGFDPNLAYGGYAAILSGGADFNSCYSRVVNSPITGSIPFGRLRQGIHLCIFDDSQLALVTLLSVSQTEYRLTGTVTVWRVMTTS